MYADFWFALPAVTDSNGNGMVERHEFSKFIFELAKADLRVDSGADARE